MKFTPTDLFKAIAMGSGKYIQLKAFARITSVLSDPLDSGVPWIDVGIHLASNEEEPKLPTMWTKVEWKVGKPAFDSIELEGIHIPFWRDNIFGVCSVSQLIEFKIEMRLGLSESQVASDVVYGFSGYVDKIPIWHEKEGTLTFTVIGHDEIGSRMSAEILTTQILNNNIDGNGLVGTRLEKLVGLYVTNANISGHQLKTGIHTVSLSETAGSPNVWKAKLDDGEDVTLPASSGTATLINGGDTQRITIYVLVDELQELTDTVTQNVIQKTVGDTLPSTWYNHCWIFQFLKLLYAKIGLTDYTFDNFRIPTYDGRRTTSYWDVPPGDSYYDNPTAIACDNTNNKVWIGIKDRIYTHDMTTHLYAFVGTVPSGYTVMRLWCDDVAAGFIWGVALDVNGVTKIIKIVIATSTLTTYTTTRTEGRAHSEENFAIDLTVRGIYYLINDGTTICLFLLDTLTEVSHYMAGYGRAHLPAFCDGSNNYYYQIYLSAPFDLMKVSYDGSSFNFTHIYTGWYQQILNGTYSITLGLWVGSQYVQSTNNYFRTVKWSPQTNTLTSISAGGGRGYVSDEQRGWVYWISRVDYQGPWGAAKSVRRMNASTTETLGVEIPYDIGRSAQICYDVTNDRIIGYFGQSGIIFEHGIKSSMYIDIEADWSGMFIIDAIREIEESFELVGVVSPNKRVHIYRRFDEDGNPKTSGQTASITIEETEDIQKEENYILACTAVIVDNGIESHSYDGANFDTGFLGDGRIARINGRFIPTAILKDVAVYAYGFFSKNLSLYTFPLANVSLWQYECFDALSVTFTETKIQKTATGPMYGVGIDPNGPTIFQALL